jgi:hypothetical protein
MAKINYDAFRAIKYALQAEQSATADYVLADLTALGIWGNRVGVPKNWADTIELPERLVAAVSPAVIAAADKEAELARAEGCYLTGTDTATHARKILCGS